MKRKLFTLLLTATVLGVTAFAQDGKSPHPASNSLENTVKLKSTVNIPTTNWIDYSDVSWYNHTASTFTINTASQLAGLAKLVFDGNDFTGKTISINADIDVSQHLWTPIGYSFQKPFSGTILGNNKTVKNIFIHAEKGSFIGLFGQVFKGTLKDLTAENVIIRAKDTAGGFVGNLSTNSLAENCHARNVDIIVTGFNTGGFAGSILTDSHVKNSSATGSIDGDSQIGGFTGSTWDLSSITNSYAEGKVSGNYIIGGFVGFTTFAFAPSRDNTITNSYARADVEGRYERAGGFYGGPQSNVIVKNAYAVGKITSPMNSGSFTALLGNAQITNAHYDKSISSLDPVGGYEYGEISHDIKGQTTTDMKSEAFVSILNANSEDKPWILVPGLNEGYPVLKPHVKLATNNVSEKSNITLYPTVSSDYINLSTDKLLQSYAIYDATGRLVGQNRISTSNTKITISNLPSGTYWIHVNTSDENKTLKFIKK